MIWNVSCITWRGRRQEFVSLTIMKRTLLLLLVCVHALCASGQDVENTWIRINQLGYKAGTPKVAILTTKASVSPGTFGLVDASTDQVVFSAGAGKSFGAYGPFSGTWRLDFTTFRKPGQYYLRAGDVRSPEFTIGKSAYDGTADFALNYMRQQRSGYNPFLKDSCHTRDGYTLYGPMPDGTFVDVSGGWHDATDYLQYSATSANATYLLLAAYRDFPMVFRDKHLANGLEGNNKRPDVLDEAIWGLEWLSKMHPQKDWMFNQIADDRDHTGYRLPNKDSADYGYGKGKGRPVYFVSGEVQGLGKHKNRTTGTSSTAGKFATAFALGAQIFSKEHLLFDSLLGKARSAYDFGLAKPGVMQTAPNKARYFYEEDNWVDDMELGAALLFQTTKDQRFQSEALAYAEKEKITLWLGADTANHYQWYPFISFGHYELASHSEGNIRKQLIAYYREGIDKVWRKAQGNAFYRGIPYIWCSNNFTAAFAIQCYLYRKLSNDNQYYALEQACIDWLFGCNPWGTSMVCGLPSSGDSPVDPHSSFSVLHKLPLDGGLVDGPVSGHIFNSLLGVTLSEPDEYAAFQSDLAVYHDDYGDYSTNEPTMDGVAYLIYLLAQMESTP